MLSWVVYSPGRYQDGGPDPGQRRSQVFKKAPAVTEARRETINPLL
ncbi:hypothetical protein TPY_2859 [Sulfobacillus acidophilus TPY]|nr:hypothetical protein TPY_2859 [Sulfobacillus acidophilus TPY]